MREAPVPWPVRLVRGCLPSSIRTGVFEPVYEDLRREFVTSGDAAGRRLRFAIGLVWATCASLFYAAPRYFRDNGRVTRLGGAALAVGGGTVLVLVAMLVPWIAYIAKLR